MQSASKRRIVALVMPDLLCEIVGEVRRSTKGNGRRPHPLAVLFGREGETKANEQLVAVNETARYYGVRPGQTVTEACALLSQLTISEVTEQDVQICLGRIAEMALGFGTTVSVQSPDTVWIDITGVAHLMGGELELASELVSKVRALGHVVRAAVSTGPRLAQAFARWKAPSAGRDTVWVIEPEQVETELASLPLMALPIAQDHAAWFMRLGVLTIGQLVQLPRASTASRLGEEAASVLELARGQDTTPLVAFEPPNKPMESVFWEEPVEGSEPLLFALRGLVARLSARLEGRGEALAVVHLFIQHDRSIAGLRGAETRTVLPFKLSTPLWRADELWRVMSAKLGRTRLKAPTIGLELEATAITRALKLQLDLSRSSREGHKGGARNPETLPVLLAELAADIGWEALGTLVLQNTHRPEEKSRLAPVEPMKHMKSRRRKRAATGAGPEISSVGVPDRAPTRLLPQALLLETALRPGGTLAVGRRLYSIEQVEFEKRIDSVEWWTENAVKRDYLRLWLQSGQSGMEVLVYVDRETGKRFLQAVCD